jgi:flagellar biosynthesis protein FliR
LGKVSLASFLEKSCFFGGNLTVFEVRLVFATLKAAGRKIKIQIGVNHD